MVHRASMSKRVHWLLVPGLLLVVVLALGLWRHVMVRLVPGGWWLWSFRWPRFRLEEGVQQLSLWGLAPARGCGATW
jgi:hypothetical protein